MTKCHTVAQRSDSLPILPYGHGLAFCIGFETFGKSVRADWQWFKLNRSTSYFSTDRASFKCTLGLLGCSWIWVSTVVSETCRQVFNNSAILKLARPVLEHFRSVHFPVSIEIWRDLERNFSQFQFFNISKRSWHGRTVLVKFDSAILSDSAIITQSNKNNSRERVCLTSKLVYCFIDRLGSVRHFVWKYFQPSESFRSDLRSDFF